MPDGGNQTYGDLAPDRRPNGTFLPGQGGRPKGSRNKLGEQFLDDLQSLWATEGAACLKEARDDKPMEFAKMVAGLLPKELLIRRTPEDEMTDDDLADTIAALYEAAERIRADRSRDITPASGTGEAESV